MYYIMKQDFLSIVFSAGSIFLRIPVDFRNNSALPRKVPDDSSDHSLPPKHGFARNSAAGLTGEGYSIA